MTGPELGCLNFARFFFVKKVADVLTRPGAPKLSPKYIRGSPNMYFWVRKSPACQNHHQKSIQVPSMTLFCERFELTFPRFCSDSDQFQCWKWFWCLKTDQIGSEWLENISGELLWRRKVTESTMDASVLPLSTNCSKSPCLEPNRALKNWYFGRLWVGPNGRLLGFLANQS